MSTKRIAFSVLALVALTPEVATAFKPTNAKRVLPTDETHVTITEAAIKRAQEEYFPTVKKPTRTMNDATKAMVLANSEIDLGNVGANVEVPSPSNFFVNANHFDAESFVTGQLVLAKGFQDVVAQLKAGNIHAARTRLGNTLHTLQDFYAHTDAVELNMGVHPGTIPPFPPLSGRATPGQDTCHACEGSDYLACSYPSGCPAVCMPEGSSNSCRMNVVSDQLTSGYFGVVSGTKPPGKCSHGGKWDRTSYGNPNGGINKDSGDCQESPHQYLHKTAADVATTATKSFLDELKKVISPDALKALFGVGPSLIFVIDTTSSMQPIIDRVKTQVSSIIDKRIQADDPPIQYVLMPFNDPGVGPVTTTDDPAAFKAALAGLVAEGGDDCPELAYTGIDGALAAAQDGGELFLFTDASAKDFFTAGAVNARALKKGIAITPLLFGSCSPIDPNLIRSSEETGGQVFVMPPAEADKITQVVDFAVRSNKVDILAIADASNGVARTYTVPVDSTMKSVTFSASRAATVSLTGPDGMSVTASTSGATVVTLSPLATGEGGGVVYSVENPTPGNWMITLDGPETFSLSVSAESPLFVAGFDFLEEGGRDPGHDGLFPISGLPTVGDVAKVRARLTPEFSTAQFELRGPAGDLLQMIPMTRDTDTASDDFFGETALPAGTFKVYVTGTDLKGVPFQRLLPASIRPTTIRLGRPPVPPLQRGLTTTLVLPVSSLAGSETVDVVVQDTAGYLLASSTLGPTAVGPGSPNKIIVNLRPPLDAEPGSVDTVTVTVQSKVDPMMSNFAVLEPVVALDEPDRDAAAPSPTPTTDASATDLAGNAKSSDGGCGCELAGPHPRSRLALVLALLVLVAQRRCRRNTDPRGL